jgi:hypothetical protein
VTGERWRQNVVMALEDRQHQFPGPPRVGEPMQAHHGLPEATAIRRGERAKNVTDSMHGYVSNLGRDKGL